MSKQGPGQNSRDLARHECSLILASLAAPDDPHEAIHSVRKSIRRLRALLGLLERGNLDLRQIDRTLQRVGRSLSAVRDAHVVTEAAVALQAAHAEHDWAPAITAMAARRARVLQKALRDDPAFSRRAHQVMRVAERLEQQPWDSVKPADIQAALARSERRAHKAAKRAEKGDDPGAVHRWRRRVRRLRMQLEALPHMGMKSVAGQGGKAGGSKRAKALHQLSDRLGWSQDIRLLRNLVRSLPAWDGKSAIMQITKAL